VWAVGGRLFDELGLIMRRALSVANRVTVKHLSTGIKNPGGAGVLGSTFFMAKINRGLPCFLVCAR
jgi:hypothetical protein